MSIHVIRTEKAADWIARHLGDPDIKSAEDLGPCTAFGVIIDREVVAGIALNEFRSMSNGNDVRVVAAATSPGWCRRGVLSSIFRYAFHDLGCSRMTSLVREGNTRSLRFTLGLGFKKEGVVRRGWNGKTNAILLGMLKSECKWI